MSNESSKATTKPHEGAKLDEHDDDVIHVPKGGSKARFVMTFLLVIMLLTTFSVSSEVVACFTGKKSAADSYMSWKHPSQGVKHVSANDFVLEKQVLNKLWNIMIGRQQKDKDDEDTAFYIMMTELAEDAGIRVTDAEVKKIIASRFGSAEVYRQTLAANRTTPKEFEAALRRALEVERYQKLMTAGVATPDPVAVEKLWKTRHQEYAFDYVELAIESLTEEAKAQLPGDDELKTWFEAQPQVDKDAFKTEPAASAELAVFPLEGEAPTTDALFAKYPRLAGEDLDAIAKDYYDGFFYARFRNKDLPLGKVPKQEDLFLPYDKVKDQAKREAPIYRSLSDWQSDIALRVLDGTAVDFETEAKALGLVYFKAAKPLTQGEWEKVEAPWAGRYIGDTLITNGTAGQFLPTVIVDQKALAFGRALEKQEGVLPAFDVIRERVAVAWTKKRAGELALKKLEAMRDTLGTKPDPADQNAPPFRPEVDSEKFAAAAKAAGFEVKLRDYQERAKPAADASAVDTYLVSASGIYSMKESSVAPAALARDGAHAYLVRVVGLRDPDSSKMTAADLSTLGQQITRENVTNFANKTFRSAEYMKSEYGLDLETWKQENQKKQAN